MVKSGRFPFLWPALALATGIGLNLYVGGYFQLPNWLWICLLLVFAAFSYFLRKKVTPVTSTLASILLLLAVVTSGFGISKLAQLPAYKSFAFQNFKTPISYLKIQLTDELSEKRNSWRAPCRVLSGYDSNGRAWQLAGKILVYWPKKSNQHKPNLGYGAEIIVPNKSILIPSAAFPEDFDFRAVMRYQNVQHQLFVHQNSWVVAGYSPQPIKRLAIQIRTVIIERLQTAFDKKTAGLLASLMVGFRDDLDPDDLRTFAQTGTMHVLAVSGMHVGLLYLLLLLLFTGKRQADKLPLWKSVFVLLLLWLFAWVTGLSASVVRAGIMFSIIEVGRSWFSKKGSLVNSLFAAAFVQLLISPMSLIDTGFQLSYLAVLGIAVLFPWFLAFWVPPTKWLTLVYQSALLSVCATIATLPISLYYFKSFPVWFIPANIVIVPLSTVLIIGGILSSVFLSIPWIGGVLVIITKWLSSSLLVCSRFFSELPFASINQIQFTELDTCLLATFIAAAVALAMTKKKLYFVLALVSMFCIGFLNLWFYRASATSQELIVCELRSKVLLAHRSGRELVVYSKPLTRSTADSLFQFMKNYCSKFAIHHVNWVVDKYPIEGSKAPLHIDKNRNFLFVSHNKPYCLVWNPYFSEPLAHNAIQIAPFRLKKYLVSNTPNALWLKNSFLRFDINP